MHGGPLSPPPTSVELIERRRGLARARAVRTVRRTRRDAGAGNATVRQDVRSPQALGPEARGRGRTASTTTCTTTFRRDWALTCVCGSGSKKKGYGLYIVRCKRL